MNRTTSVTLGESLNEFVERMIASGRYGSTSEVMRSALRLLEKQESELELLRQAIDEGDSSGESQHSITDIVDRVKARLDV